jgi:hypothetical protein
MLNKIFLIACALAVLTVGFLYFYASSWLSSIGEPRAAFEGFMFYLSVSWNALWITSGALLLLANLAFWKTRTAWTIWVTFGFFSAFVLLRYFWLEGSGAAFRENKLGAESGFNLSILLGVVLIFLFAVIAFFNQYLSLRLYEKMYPAETVPELESEPSD